MSQLNSTKRSTTRYISLKTNSAIVVCPSCGSQATILVFSWTQINYSFWLGSIFVQRWICFVCLVCCWQSQCSPATTAKATQLSNVPLVETSTVTGACYVFSLVEKNISIHALLAGQVLSSVHLYNESHMGTSASGWRFCDGLCWACWLIRFPLIFFSTRVSGLFILIPKADIDNHRFPLDSFSNMICHPTTLHPDLIKSPSERPAIQTCHILVKMYTAKVDIQPHTLSLLHGQAMVLVLMLFAVYHQTKEEIIASYEKYYRDTLVKLSNNMKDSVQAKLEKK